MTFAAHSVPQAYAREEPRREDNKTDSGIGAGDRLRFGASTLAMLSIGKILTDTPKEILYAAADADASATTFSRSNKKKEIRHTQEVRVIEKLFHTQNERNWQSRTPNGTRQNPRGALGRGQKSLVRGAGSGPRRIAKWEPKHQPAPALDPRAEFAAVLWEIGGVVQGSIRS